MSIKIAPQWPSILTSEYSSPKQIADGIESSGRYDDFENQARVHLSRILEILQVSNTEKLTLGELATKVQNSLTRTHKLINPDSTEENFLNQMDEALTILKDSFQRAANYKSSGSTDGTSYFFNEVNLTHFVEYLGLCVNFLESKQVQRRSLEATDATSMAQRQAADLKRSLIDTTRSDEVDEANLPDSSETAIKTPFDLNTDIISGVKIIKMDVDPGSKPISIISDIRTLLNERGMSATIPSRLTSVDMPTLTGDRDTGCADFSFTIESNRPGRLLKIPSALDYEVQSVSFFDQAGSELVDAFNAERVYRDEFGFVHLDVPENCREIRFRLQPITVRSSIEDEQQMPQASIANKLAAIHDSQNMKLEVVGLPEELRPSFVKSKTKEDQQTSITDTNGSLALPDSVLLQSYDPHIVKTDEDDFYEKLVQSRPTVADKVQTIQLHHNSGTALFTRRGTIKDFIADQPNFFQAQKAIGVKGDFAQLSTYLCNELRRFGIKSMLVDAHIVLTNGSQRELSPFRKNNTVVAYFDENNNPHILDPRMFIRREPEVIGDDILFEDPNGDIMSSSLDRSKSIGDGDGEEDGVEKDQKKLLDEIEAVILKGGVGDPVLGPNTQQVQQFNDTQFDTSPRTCFEPPKFKPEDDIDYPKLAVEVLFKMKSIRSEFQKALKTGSLSEITKLRFEIIKLKRFISQFDKDEGNYGYRDRGYYDRAKNLRKAILDLDHSDGSVADLLSYYGSEDYDDAIKHVLCNEQSQNSPRLQDEYRKLFVHRKTFRGENADHDFRFYPHDEVRDKVVYAPEALSSWKTDDLIEAMQTRHKDDNTDFKLLNELPRRKDTANPEHLKQIGDIVSMRCTKEWQKLNSHDPLERIAFLQASEDPDRFRDFYADIMITRFTQNFPYDVPWSIRVDNNNQWRKASINFSKEGGVLVKHRLQELFKAYMSQTKIKTLAENLFKENNDNYGKGKPYFVERTLSALEHFGLSLEGLLSEEETISFIKQHYKVDIQDLEYFASELGQLEVESLGNESNIFSNDKAYLAYKFVKIVQPSLLQRVASSDHDTAWQNFKKRRLKLTARTVVDDLGNKAARDSRGKNSHDYEYEKERKAQAVKDKVVRSYNVDNEKEYLHPIEFIKLVNFILSKNEIIDVFKESPELSRICRLSNQAFHQEAPVVAKKLSVTNLEAIKDELKTELRNLIGENVFPLLRDFPELLSGWYTKSINGLFYSITGISETFANFILTPESDWNDETVFSTAKLLFSHDEQMQICSQLPEFQRFASGLNLSVDDIFGDKDYSADSRSKLVEACDPTEFTRIKDKIKTYINANRKRLRAFIEKAKNTYKCPSISNRLKLFRESGPEGIEKLALEELLDLTNYLLNPEERLELFEKNPTLSDFFKLMQPDRKTLFQDWWKSEKIDREAWKSEIISPIKVKLVDCLTPLVLDADFKTMPLKKDDESEVRDKKASIERHCRLRIADAVVSSYQTAGNRLTNNFLVFCKDPTELKQNLRQLLNSNVSNESLREKVITLLEEQIEDKDQFATVKFWLSQLKSNEDLRNLILILTSDESFGLRQIGIDPSNIESNLLNRRYNGNNLTVKDTAPENQVVPDFSAESSFLHRLGGQQMTDIGQAKLFSALADSSESLITRLNVFDGYSEDISLKRPGFKTHEKIRRHIDSFNQKSTHRYREIPMQLALSSDPRQSSRRSKSFSEDEFKDLREYAPGDSIKRVNWAATARSGKPIVNTFQAFNDDPSTTYIIPFNMIDSLSSDKFLNSSFGSFINKLAREIKEGKKVNLAITYYGRVFAEIPNHELRHLLNSSTVDEYGKRNKFFNLALELIYASTRVSGDNHNPPSSSSPISCTSWLPNQSNPREKKGKVVAIGYDDNELKSSRNLFNLWHKKGISIYKGTFEALAA
ncbi:MAG: DUF58 domain-containing protein [Cyanobacteria bacterium]|nr:DUF58 domain-containing protein [Cyanobacteriota bacterium]